MTDQVVTVDGTPLKKKLAQALFLSRIRAFGLVVPLLLLILGAFVWPVAAFLHGGIHNDDYGAPMHRTAAFLSDWDGAELPDEQAYASVVADIIEAGAVDRPLATKAAARLNREYAGATSATKKLMRKVRNLKLTYDDKEAKASAIFRTLEKEGPDRLPILSQDERRTAGIALAEEAMAKHGPFKPMLEGSAKQWKDIEMWRAMKVASRSYTPAYVAAALDYNYTYDGRFEPRAEDRQIHVMLFLRTLEISLIVTLACLVLGYPVAYLLSTLPARTSNLLLILVLLPFWTSILVRTTAWIAMLQGQGVMNDLFVVFGLASDEARFSLIYNKTGTLIAMTHILLPFMILPIYSVMKTIPPSYVRAAKSLGATNWTAFWRVYFPQSVAGIGAGAILVFILAIGYYITPALVGGQDGLMISNIIDDHMRRSLNWSLAAALGAVLLVFVLILYWIYDRIVGIDNMKLG